MAALPDLVEDVDVFPLLMSLSDCLCTELALEQGPGLCLCGVVPGDLVPLDMLSDKGTGTGMAWVRLTDAFLTDNFPDQITNAARCTLTPAYGIEVGVARCYPVGEARRPPSTQEWFEAARLQTADMAAMLRAIRCCFGSQENVDEAVVGYSPLPIGGGVGGGVWQLNIQRAW